MQTQNPFKIMAHEAGTIQELMVRLHPASYSAVHSLIMGRNERLGPTIRRALGNHYTGQEIEAIERDYMQWREERSKRRAREG